MPIRLEPTASDRRWMRFAVVAVAGATPVVIVLAFLTTPAKAALPLAVGWIVLALSLFRSPMWRSADDE